MPFTAKHLTVRTGDIIYMVTAGFAQLSSLCDCCQQIKLNSSSILSSSYLPKAFRYPPPHPTAPSTSVLHTLPCNLPRWLRQLRHSAHRPGRSIGGAGVQLPQSASRFCVWISGVHALRLISQVCKQGLTVSSIICDCWLILR